MPTVHGFLCPSSMLGNHAASQRLLHQRAPPSPCIFPFPFSPFCFDSLCQFPSAPPFSPVTHSFTHSFTTNTHHPRSISHTSTAPPTPLLPPSPPSSPPSLKLLAHFPQTRAFPSTQHPQTTLKTDDERSRITSTRATLLIAVSLLISLRALL